MINNQPIKETGPNQQPLINRLILASVLALGLAGLVVGCACAKKKEATVSLAQLSAPARATVERLTAGGQVDKLSKEVERGKNVYDVEATVGGKHVEYVIAEADGAVLGTETPIEFSELPEAVRAAAEKFFGKPTGLKAMKGVEYGETSYEIEGLKNGKTVEATFDPTGKQIE
jgi:uncharacterized membrane protein YkoI